MAFSEKDAPAAPKAPSAPGPLKKGAAPPPPVSLLTARSLAIVCTNAVPAYGVLALHWNAFALILMFLLEGLVVLFSDYVKNALKRPGQKVQGNLFFETMFILFFGFFAILVFGPAKTNAFEFSDKAAVIRSLAASPMRIPLLAMVGFRLVHLVQDLAAGGLFGGNVRQPLEFDGGGWMLLLFFAVMLAPWIAKTGPNPAGGLLALVALKTAGEVIAVWAVRIK